jgi:DNA invertase Pin-like site-specific DNA recombinase
MASGKQTDERTRQQIIKLLQNGVSVRETAKAARVNPSTVVRCAKRPIIS